MAKSEHLALLIQGIEQWNEWRSKNEHILPDLREADMVGADLSQANLSGADLGEANLIGANLRWAKLRWARVSKAKLRGANLREANLILADLSQANLSRTDLSEADLIEADVSRADLSGAGLTQANLSRARLSEANLDRADLRWAKLRDANLRKANLRNASLRWADLSGADLSGADLSGADLSGAILISTKLDGADLSGASIFGISAWDLSLEGATQKSLIIQRSTEETPIALDDLEVAQFIYLLLNHRRLRKVITTLGEKAVLILGRFAERKELRDSIATRLRQLDYLPIIFDFERPTHRDFIETVKVLASLSRFVIADITNPISVPFELGATVPDYMVPFVTILQRGQPAWRMFDDLPRKYHWALPLLEYKSPETLMAAFESEVVFPALEKLEEVRRQKALLPVEHSLED
jgi:uncharacterized protein YjbI with pentapeptide repeats